MIYRATVYSIDEPLVTFGAENERELTYLFVLICHDLRHKAPLYVSAYDLQEEGGHWWHPTGRNMSEAWDGKLPAEAVLKVGSAIFYGR